MPAVIHSTSNTQVKWLRSLAANSRLRHRERCFVVEGMRLMTEALAVTRVRVALYNPDQLAATPQGATLLHTLSTTPGCFAAAPHALAAATSTIHPQGVVAAVEWPQVVPTDGLWLLLDAIQDPGNVGTLLRSAAAAGVGRVVALRGTADLSNPKVVRAAMGAHFALALQEDATWDTLATTLRALPNVYAAVAERASATPYYALDWCQPAALIIGSEAHGISAAGLALATQAITIPMAGHAESLNAAIAGSILLFEMVRQRAAATSARGKQSMPERGANEPCG